MDLGISNMIGTVPKVHACSCFACIISILVYSKGKCKLNVFYA